MSRLLLTQSLISAWKYTFDCFEGSEEQAMEDFMRTLRREPSEPTEAMQNGINFENEVYKLSSGLPRTAHPKWERGITSVAKYIVGAPTQVKCQREFSVDGCDFLIFGIMDAIKAGHIYDVKFSNKSLGSIEAAGKYLDSPQHPAYLFCVPEAMDFTYLLSDGDELYAETYTRALTRPFPEIASEFIKSIESMGLLSLYQEKWAAK